MNTPPLLKYSNGWGHLLMSLALLAVSVILLLQHDGTLNAVGIGLITSVSGYWFVSSSANSQQQSTVSVNVPPPAITVAPSPQQQGSNS